MVPCNKTLLTSNDPAYPDESYIASVAKLNHYPNVQVLGYIPTNYAERDLSDVKEEVSTYSNWASYKAKNITVSGVFFDEAPDTNDKTKIAYMQRISRAARARNLTTVVFNPGATLEEGSAQGYFRAADLIVEFENSYAEWMSSVPAKQFSASDNYAKDAIILYSAPLDRDYDAVVQEAQSMGLGAAYLTCDDNYMSVDTVMKVAASFTQI